MSPKNVRATEALIEKLELAAKEELNDRYSLQGYAAHAAALVLLDNWRDALSVGCKLSQLLGDLTNTIKVLAVFEKALKEVPHAAPAASNQEAEALHKKLVGLAQQHLEERGVLEGYAAHAAAKVLLCNWEDALCDGYLLSRLVGDVPDVVELLDKFKQRANELLEAQRAA